MRFPHRLSALGAAAVVSLTLAACGTTDDAAGATSSDTSSSASASSSVEAEHDAADVSFTQQMIVHHTGAVEMARMATTQASTQQVKDLATRIEAAQQPEIDQMTSWLTAWGEPVSATGSMEGMDHSSGSTGAVGMMTSEQMDQLRAATGTGFDRMFLQMMTAHHRGAIEMAKTEQANGSNPHAIALATSIETSQSAEVAEMGQLLTTLGS